MIDTDESTDIVMRPNGDSAELRILRSEYAQLKEENEGLKHLLREI